MATVLVTGGAGFIGSHIVKELIELGHKPIVLDTFSQYVSPLEKEYKESRSKRFEGMMDKIELERGNTAHYSTIHSVLYKYKPDYIIHLAALPVAKLQNLNVEEGKEGTIDSTARIIEVINEMKKNGAHEVKKFVYTSSSMVYGDFQTDVATEGHQTKPNTIYGIMKLAGESVTKGLCKLFDINYCIIRPSAVYGPTDMNKRVSQIFVDNALQGKPVIVQGGEDEKLDFSYVKDVAKGFVLATFSEKANSQVFNITGGKARSILDYARIVKQYFPNLEIIQKPRDETKPKRGTLDISKAKELLGYNPEYDVEKGIKAYIEYIKTQKK